MTKKVKFAFALSEVLITLGVIGVVAAMTLPTLIKNYKKHSTENQLKTAYSIFSQAINSAKSEHGDFKNWDITLPREDLNNTYLKPYLTIVESKKINEIKTLNDSGNFLYSQTYFGPTYYLKNGMRYTILKDNINLYITIDINGDKGPNTMGYDCFNFIIESNSNQLLPDCNKYSNEQLTEESSYSKSCNPNAAYSPYSGACCAEIIRRNNWKIPDDYPW